MRKLKPRRAECRPGVVYVISGRHEGLVKIGITVQRPQLRFGDIQTHHGPLTVHGIMEFAEPRFVERRAHRLLKAHRIFGEWFRVTPDTAICTVQAAGQMIETEPTERTMSALDASAVGKTVYVRGFGCGVVREIGDGKVSVELTEPDLPKLESYAKQVGNVQRYPNDGNFVYLTANT